jgi:hypothetical protein
MAEAPSSVHRLLTVIRARVSSLSVAPRRARPVATLAVSLRGPERPLGQAPASLAVGHGGESTVDPWTGHPGAGPRARDRVRGICY